MPVSVYAPTSFGLIRLALRRSRKNGSPRSPAA